MNKLEGHIRKVDVSGNLSRVRVELTGNIQVNAIVIETPETASYLQMDRPIYVLFKETEVILAKDPEVGVSLENRISGKVERIKEGTLFCEVLIQTPAGEIQSLISRETLGRWPIKTGDAVTAMVKMNEIMLQE